MGARLCLACRTWLGDERRCDLCGEEHVVDLSDEAGRERAIATAWVGGSRKRGGGCVSILAVVVALVVTLSVVLPFLRSTVGALVSTALFIGLLLAMAILRDKWKLSRLLDRHARGSTLALRPPGPVLRGKVLGPATIQAEGLMLALRHHEITCRYGASRGFTVALDDGRTVEIPAGRLRLEAPPTAGERLGRERAVAELRRITRLVRVEEAFPFRTAHRLCVLGGDPVEIVSEVERLANLGSSYREAPAGTLTPRRTPWIRLREADGGSADERSDSDGEAQASPHDGDRRG